MLSYRNFCLAFCLLFMACNFGLGVFSDEEDKSIQKDLVLVQMKVNGFGKGNSEILVLDDKVFLPIKQIAQLCEVTVNFDRESKRLAFFDVVKSQPVVINPTDKTIKIGENLLDITATQVYWVKQSVSLVDEILISKELVEQLLDVKINYNEDTLSLDIAAPRLIKATAKSTKKYSQAEEDEPADLVRPQAKKFLLQSISPIYTTQASITERSTPTDSQTDLGFGNYLGLNVVADAYDGTYIAGPAFFFSDQEIGFAGMRQTWYKKINDNYGLMLGDSNSQLSRLNTGGQVFGVRMGTPKNLGISQDTVVTLQGSCANESEVLLIVNNQQIARQVCSNGTYQIKYVPRLVDVNNEFRVLQRNTDGTELILREERFNYFGDLLPKKKKAWQAFFGTPPLELFNSRSSIGLGQNGQDTKADPFPRKITGGAQYQYGLSDRMTLETIFSGDRLTRSAREPFTKFLPVFNNQSSLEGETLSFGIYSRPKDRFGLRLGGAFSHSSDATKAQLSRTGLGKALTLDYDWRVKGFSSIGNFYYFSPEFYNPASSANNRAGGNISINGIYKKNYFRFNGATFLTNLDKKSADGLQQRNNIAFNHSYRPNNNTQIQNNFIYRESKNDVSSSNIVSYRAFALRNINKRVSATSSVILTNRKTFQPTLRTDFLGQVTVGGILFLDNRKRNQISQSFSLDTEDRFTSFTQFRWRYKNWIFQPSLSLQTNPGGTRNYRLANGVFWQGTNSSRFGIEYAVSSSQASTSTFDSFGGIIVGGKNKSINHSVALNLQTVVGFVDNKPHILTSTQTGYIRGKVFLDMNNNGQYEQGERLINQAKMKLNGKEIVADKKGDLLASDIGRGIHKVALDPKSIPLTLSPAVDFINVKVEPGKVTEIFFPLKIESATIEGRVTVLGSDGKPRSVNNIVVIASDLSGKEITYTYTDRDGYYILSDLRPGDFIIHIDARDVINRKLVIADNSKKVNLPLSLDEFIEIKGINFEATQTVFGLE